MVNSGIMIYSGVDFCINPHIDIYIRFSSKVNIMLDGKIKEYRFEICKFIFLISGQNSLLRVCLNFQELQFSVETRTNCPYAATFLDIYSISPAMYIYIYINTYIHIYKYIYIYIYMFYS